MVRKSKASEIEFEMWYMEKGVFFTVRLPYSERNWKAVTGLHKSRNIKVIRKPI